MYKVERSNVLKMSVMVGIEPNSGGLKWAKDCGYEKIATGIDGLMELGRRKTVGGQEDLIYEMVQQLIQ